MDIMSVLRPQKQMTPEQNTDVLKFVHHMMYEKCNFNVVRNWLLNITNGFI